MYYVEPINIFYLGLYARIPFFKPVSVRIKQQPISIVICARNEAENLDRYLPAVLTQKYSDYEVIVVNFIFNWSCKIW